MNRFGACLFGFLQPLAIVLLSILAAVVYGILHDQLALRVCPGYFAYGLRQVFFLEDAPLKALGWGFAGTWWVGLLLGVPLAIVARGGEFPRRTVRSLIRPIAIVLGITAAGALAGGGLGLILAAFGVETLPPDITSRLPAGQPAWYIADHYAQQAAYIGGFVCGLTALIRVWRSRRQASIAALDSRFQLPARPSWHRLHLSSWAVLLAATCLAIVIVAPANLVYGSPEYESMRIDTFYRLEHGWPFTYLSRQWAPWNHGNPFEVVWGLGRDVQEFKPFALVADFLIAALGVSILVGFYEWRRRNRVRGRRFQFSLRSMLITFTILTVVVGWYFSELASDRKLRMHLGGLGAISSSGPWPPVNDESLVFGSEKPWSRLPLWLVFTLGSDSDIVGINEPGPLTLLWHRSKHEHIQYLVDRCPPRVSVKFMKIGTDADWSLIAQMTSLEYAGFLDRGSEALPHLESFRRLRSLDVCDSPDSRKITDADLVHLHHLFDLETLTVLDADLSGAGFSHLRSLAHLRELVIRTSSLSEAAIEPLEQLPALEYLRLIGPVSDDLAEKLKARLENRRNRPIRVSLDNPGVIHIRGL